MSASGPLADVHQMATNVRFWGQADMQDTRCSEIRSQGVARTHQGAEGSAEAQDLAASSASA